MAALLGRVVAAESGMTGVAKAQYPAATITALEAQIDHWVCALHRLTAEETKIVERREATNPYVLAPRRKF